MATWIPDQEGNTSSNGSEDIRRRRLLSDVEEMVRNASTSRIESLRKLLTDPRRNIDDECGYPDEPTIQMYQDMYDREAIATRVVQALPKECWQIQPTVYESKDVKRRTRFERAWDNLGRSMKGPRGSWYQDEGGNVIWEYLRRVDELSGIGRYGVLLLGIDDGLSYDQPVAGVNSDSKSYFNGYPQGTDREYYNTSVTTPSSSYYETPPNSSESYQNPTESEDSPVKTKRNLLYMRAFSEHLVEITQYESDLASPRCGEPLYYNITINDPREQISGVGLPLSTIRVHWSRVIHVADNRGTSEVFGAPRMRPVFNRLLDLKKLYGGSAEMYWRGAFPGLSFETHPQLGGDVIVDKQGLKDTYENYINGLQRALFSSGYTVKSLAPTVVDPRAQVEIHIEAICVQLGMPVRIFKGSERGQLASSQDDASWNDRLRERLYNYLTPRLICPLVDRLIAIGVLPEPKGYSVEWPPLDSVTEKDKATVALSKTQALSVYVSGGVDTVIAPSDYLTRLLGIDEADADLILEATRKYQETKRAEEEKERQKQQSQLSPNPLKETQPYKAKDGTVSGSNPTVEATKPSGRNVDLAKGFRVANTSDSSNTLESPITTANVLEVISQVVNEYQLTPEEERELREQLTVD